MNIFSAAKDRHCLLVRSASPSFCGNIEMMSIGGRNCTISRNWYFSYFFRAYNTVNTATFKRYLVTSSWDILFRKGAALSELRAGLLSLRSRKCMNTLSHNGEAMPDWEMLLFPKWNKTFLKECFMSLPTIAGQ